MITKINTDHEVMLGNVILDTKTNTVRSAISGENKEVDDLVRVLNDEISGHTTKIEKDETTQETVIKIIDANKHEQELARTKNGSITSLHLYKGTFHNNKKFTKLDLPQLQKIEADSVENENSLTTLNIPEQKTIHIDKNCFKVAGAKLEEKLSVPIDLDGIPSLTTGILGKKLSGPIDLDGIHSLTTLNLPQLQNMDSDCIQSAPKLKEKTLYPILPSKTKDR